MTSHPVPSGKPLPTSASCSKVSVYPSPGTRTASTTSQISFRNVSPSALSAGHVQVSGSQSGDHSGRWVADSDGRGASFYPSTPFQAGETVRVKTGLHICGAARSTFRFTVARPPATPPKAPGKSGPPPTKLDQPVETFASLPGVQVPKLEVKVPNSLGGDYLFETPHGVTTLGGPMIVDGKGNVVWFQPLPPEVIATDFRERTYKGKPVLTYWKGQVITGHGEGEDVIMNSSYQVIKTIGPGNGYQADLHEFLLTSQGTAWVTAYQTVGWNLQAVGGPQDGAVLDGIVEEVDVASGNVLFEWHSLDHVAISLTNQSYSAGTPFDYFHVNSIDPLKSGVVVISSRNTSTVYSVAQATGRVLWRLGGKASSFRMGRGTGFNLQHNAVMRGPNSISIFDDEDAPQSKKPARGILVHLNFGKRRASLEHAYQHGTLLVPAQGDVQLLPGGEVLVGWGSGSYTSEYSKSGKLIFDAYFGSSINSYRAYAYSWVGTPTTAPGVATSTSANGGLTVYASWNGSTQTAKWEVLGGSSAEHLTPLATVKRNGFQTTIQLSTSPAKIQVVAEAANGKELGRSEVVGPKSHS
ncbi:MAG: arylsulfotransferase family protein [Candidatus Dormibacteria bacterium]